VRLSIVRLSIPSMTAHLILVDDPW